MGESEVQQDVLDRLLVVCRRIKLPDAWTVKIMDEMDREFPELEEGETEKASGEGES